MAVIIENNTLKPEQIEKIKNICKSHGNNENNLINILHETQSTFGYLPKEVQEVIAEELNIPVGRVFGVVTFYSFFTMVPKGEHPISICLGTACYVRGAEKILEEFKKELGLEVGQTTKDGKFSLSCLRCIGACGLAPVVMIGEKVYGRVTPASVKDIIAEYK
ncbi:MAG: NADH-quinone oxidoreductase subunit NuoE [Bacteroidales bacterium]|nr:NADH-quinone oxidoreductase subunit NuoE [Bacteroidales bacterium]